MKSLLIASALIAPAAASAQPDPFCEDVRALAAAAEEADPFRSLRNRDFRPRLTRGYCFYSMDDNYTCGHSLARPDETREAYAVRIQQCLPGSTLTSERDHPRDYRVVRRGRFEARVTEQGTDRAHVGRTINIYVASVGSKAR